MIGTIDIDIDKIEKELTERMLAKITVSTRRQLDNILYSKEFLNALAAEIINLNITKQALKGGTRSKKVKT